MNTRFLIKDHLEGFGHYTQEILRRMTESHPEDQFDFYFDRKYAREFLYTQNVSGTSLFPPARHPVLFYLWYQWSLKGRLGTRPPDVFFSPDSFMPLGLQCPSVITVHDVAHRPYPEGISYAHRKYYAHYIPKFLHEAEHVITVSDFSKREIIKYYDLAEEKITVVYNGIGGEYRPLSDIEITQVRKRYSQGKPYFLFVGAIHPRKNVARLIEAYSQFRASTGENVALMIAGRMSWGYSDVEEALANSPYKEDIIITGYVPATALAEITGAALAMVYVSLYEGFGLPVVESMACGVPVIVGQGGAPAEVAGPAGIEVDPMRVESIVEAMRSSALDNVLREQKITAGLRRAFDFSWDIAARETYAVLSATAEVNKNK